MYMTVSKAFCLHMNSPAALDYHVSGLTGPACILLLRSEHSVLFSATASTVPPANASTASGTCASGDFGRTWRLCGAKVPLAHAGLSGWMQLLLLFRLQPCARVPGWHTAFRLRASEVVWA